MTNKSFAASLIISATLVLLFAYSANSAQLQIAVETEYRDPIHQMMPQHMFLTPSSPFPRSLEKNQVDYYQVFIAPGDNKLTILKENLRGQVELFVSLDPTNKYPSELEHTYTTKTANTNWIELNKKDLTKACITQSLALCAIYVAVIPQETAVSYSISLESSFSKNAEPFLITPLEDGSQLTLLIPAGNSSANYYFYTFPFQPSFLTIKAYSLKKRLVAYAKVLDRNTDLSSIVDMNMPTKTSHDYISKEDMLTIPSGTPVLVVLSVAFLDTGTGRYYGDSDSESESDFPGYYSVGLESQIVPITLGRQYNSTTLSDQYRYFSFYVEDECNLLVSAKSLDGKEISFVLAPPYGDELPTIEDCEYEQRELYGAKFYEIRIEVVDGGRYSDFGTWTIGIYGQSSSEFSLIATCGSNDIMQLQRDKTEGISMRYSSSESPIHFLYKPETNNSISIRLNGAEVRRSYSYMKEGVKTKGSLSYYIRQVSKDENFIFNLPNKMNYQWSSFADINREACNDCIYIIGIEGISESSSFDITISERQDEIVEAIGGYPITKSLSSEDSNVIALLKYSQPDIYLVVTSEAEKLELYASNDSTISMDNYLWKTKIACNNQTQLLKVQRFQISQDSRSTWSNFYLQIKNPTSQNVSYTIMILAIDENSKPRTIGVGTTQTLILYSSKENETIELDVEAHPGYSPEPVGEFDLEMKVYYWPEDVCEVPALEIPVSKIHVFTEATKSYGRRYSKDEKQQIFRINSKIGKFVFLMTHTANRTLTISNKIYTLASEVLTLDQDSQTSLTLVPGKIQTYNVSLKGPGVWYLSGYSCNGINAYLSIQNDSRTQETNLTRIGPDNQVFYQAELSQGESSQMIRLALSENEDMTGFILRSTFLPKAVPYYDKLEEDLRKSNIKINATTGAISVEIYPVDFGSYDTSRDTVFHEILACPGEKTYLCGIGNDCIVKTSQEFKLQKPSYVTYGVPQPETKIEFRVEQPGKYSVIVIAHIKSHGKEIKNIIVGRSWETIINVDKQLDTPDRIEL